MLDHGVVAICDTGSSVTCVPLANTCFCSAKVGDRARFLEATSDRQRDIFNPATTEITKMMDENLVYSFWSRQLFFDACEKFEKQQDAGARIDALLRIFSCRR